MSTFDVLHKPLLSVVGAVLMAPSCIFAEVVDDFRDGGAGWKSYLSGAGETAFSHSDEESYAGRHSIRVDTPGTRALEGISKTFTVVPEHRHDLRVMAKGQGRVVLAANTPRGWIYGAHTDLTDEWQELEISFYARSDKITPAVFTVRHAQKVTFYLDNLALERLERPTLPALGVPATKLEAEDYPSNARIVPDASASGGAYSEGARWFVLASGVPFPQTGLPVYVYLKAWMDNHESNSIGIAYSGPGREPLASMKLAASRTWEWIKAGPFTVAEVPDAFRISHLGSPEVMARLDCMVLSTESDLSPAALDSAKSTLDSDRGLVTARRTPQPPTIDGRLGDGAWAGTVELGPFIRSGELEFAHDVTKAYVCYDDDYLYVAFHNKQAVLDPVSNMLHEFRNQTRDNNHESVFRDDFVAILVNPDGETTYDLFINASGAVNDARGTGDNPWSNRDTGWNSGVRVDAGIHKGYWVVEAAIPFASLGARPAAGDVWGLALGRLSQHARETSVWQPMAPGFHRPAEFGRLLFGGEVPGIRDMSPGAFSPGVNAVTMRIQTETGALPVRIQSVVTTAEGKRHAQHTDVLVSGAVEATHHYDIEVEGEMTFLYSVLNAATLRPYYRSPSYSLRVQSSVLDLKLAEGGPYGIYLNGRPLEQSTPLYPGVNVLAIETEGELRAAFGVGEYHFDTAGGWRTSENPAGSWKDPGYDDSGWELVEASVGGRIGRAGEKRYYRRVLLFNHSRFWPNWEEQGIWIAGGSLQQLLLEPRGLAGRQLNGYTLVLEVPAGFSVAGASSYYNRINLSVEDAGPAERDGNDYRVYRIQVEQPVSYRDDIPKHQYCAIPVNLAADRIATGTETTFYYRLEADNGSVTEIPQVLKVNVLPDVNGRQPEKYLWQLWTGWLANMDDSDLQARVLASLPAYGFNDVSFSKPMHEGIPLRNMRLINFQTWNMDMRPYLERHPERALLDNKKVPSATYICMTSLLEDRETLDFVAEALSGFVERAQPAHINWDYESSVWDSYISCYCERCLSRFSAHAGLAASEKLSLEAIRDNHAEAWIDYMCLQMALLADKFNGMIKAIDPEMIFSIYSGYQSERTRLIYGVDWRYLTGKMDLAMCGYGRQTASLQETLAAVGNTPLVLGELLFPYRVTELRYPSYASMATLLRRAVESTGGVLVYDLGTADGRTFYASGEVSRLIAEYEPVFVDNNRRDELADVSGMGRDDLAILESGPTRIVMLINESATQRTVRLVNRDITSGMRITDYYEKSDVAGNAEIETTVPARGVRVFIFTR